jgi:fumarylacetoacetase
VTGGRAAHLPYGVVRLPGGPVPAVRDGDRAIDLRALAGAGLLPGGGWAEAPDLGRLLAAGPDVWAEVDAALQALVLDGRLPAGAVHRLADLPPPLLPVTPGDYVDFYSSEHHAATVGRLFRPDDPDPLVPAWRQLPIGYHGRAGSVVASGTDVVRPAGHRPPAAPGGAPDVGPTRELDFELELAFLTGGPPTAPGDVLSAAEAEARIFGVVLLDDWSARDLQRHEYRPLGPFLGKSFLTSVACWVTPLAALEAARVPAPRQDPPPAPHLRAAGGWTLDLTLEVVLRPAGADPADDDGSVVARTSSADVYWTMPQQLVHAASNGAVVRPGDLWATGTISGPEAGTQGCLLEATQGGVRPVRAGAAERTWLEDGDTVVLRGHGPAVGGGRLELAPVAGTVRPARGGASG